jgi:hypothetical protein
VPTSERERATLPPNGVSSAGRIHYAPGSYSPGSGGPIVRVNYRDGHNCAVNPFRPLATSCPATGLRPTPVRAPAPQEVRAQVKARIGRGRYGRSVIVTFRAPVAVTDATAAYNVSLFEVDPGGPCSRHHPRGCGGYGAPVLRNVRAGEQVRVEQPTNDCGCTFYGVVEYRYDLRDGVDPTGSSAKTLVVGRFKVDAR